MVRHEASFVSRFKYDFLVLGFLALIGIGSWLNDHPFTFDSENEEEGGSVPPQMGSGEVLLLLGPVGSNADEFEDMDFSFAWYNALAQEVGPFKTGLAEDLNPEDLDSMRLIVVPSSATDEFDDAQISLIRSFVEQGGELILEMPGPSWSALTGVGEPVLVGRSTKRITAATGSSLQGDFNQHLLDVPLKSKMLRYDTVDLSNIKRNDLLLEIDGVPAHFHRAVGDGHVYVVGFDFGMAVTALQQGLPDDDFLIPVPEDVEDDEDEMTLPSVLVSNPRMLQSSVPYADLLERHMFYAPLRDRPAAVMWLFPDTHVGAVIMTHEERGFGDKAGFMAEYEAMLGVNSTYFVSAREISNDGLDDLYEHGTDVGIGWHRSPVNPIYESRGLGRVRPYQTELTLIEQLDRLEGWAGRAILSGRVHDLVWDRHYTATFRKLTASGLYIDSSYGPSEVDQYGYLFGTGLPFLPLDTDGLPMPIFEMPFALSDASGFGPTDDDVATRLIQESRSGFHQVINFDIDADAMAHNPQPATLETWMKALETARTERHWITSLRDYMAFYQQRRQATILSSFDRSSRVLHVTVETTPQSAHKDGNPLPVPGVGVPLRYQGAAIEAVTIDGLAVELGNVGRTGDGVLGLIAVPHGRHRLEIRYTGL